LPNVAGATPVLAEPEPELMLVPVDALVDVVSTASGIAAPGAGVQAARPSALSRGLRT
jgi:hypothetical protein